MNRMLDPNEYSLPSDEHATELAAIVDEYSSRVAAGEPVSIEEYTKRLPGSETVVKEILQSLGLVQTIRTSLTHHDVSPQRIGDYEVIEELGRGGMGIVYRARQMSLDRIVALKILPLAASLDKRCLERFRIETHSASILQHPNIVAIYGTGCEQGVHYYAMQYIHGQPLHSYKDFSDLLDIRFVVGLAKSVANALQHAHELGVVHRDIKPSNILLDDAGKIWVTDFGLAQMDDSATLTLSGDIVGTLRYMSPEQATGGTTPVDHRTDIYSLGATLYELLMQKPLVSGNGRLEILKNVMEIEASFLGTSGVCHVTCKPLFSKLQPRIETSVTRRPLNSPRIFKDSLKIGPY